MHVAYTQQGNEAGAEGAAVAVESWVSVSAECEERAREAGYRAKTVQDGDICQRVLLAWTRGENE